jgi:hypothetical protein
MRTTLILSLILGLSCSPVLAGEAEVLLDGIGNKGKPVTSNEASVLQAGIVNQASAAMSGQQGDGNRNSAIAFQTGKTNSMITEQNGSSNGAAVTQLGKDNVAITDQQGFYNDANLVQTGNDLVIVSQKGVGLSLTQQQIPDYPALIIQQGVGSRSVTKVIPLSKR